MIPHSRLWSLHSPHPSLSSIPYPPPALQYLNDVFTVPLPDLEGPPCHEPTSLPHNRTLTANDVSFFRVFTLTYAQLGVVDDCNPRALFPVVRIDDGVSGCGVVWAVLRRGGRDAGGTCTGVTCPDTA